MHMQPVMRPHSMAYYPFEPIPQMIERDDVAIGWNLEDEQRLERPRDHEICPVRCLTAVIGRYYSLQNAHDRQAWVDCIWGERRGGVRERKSCSDGPQTIESCLDSIFQSNMREILFSVVTRPKIRYPLLLLACWCQGSSNWWAAAFHPPKKMHRRASSLTWILGPIIQSHLGW